MTHRDATWLQAFFFMSGGKGAGIAAMALVSLAGCAGSGNPGVDAAERFGPRCEKLGHVRDSDAFRACVASQEIAEAAATQREYDRKLLRRTDCVDPRIACDAPMR